MGSKIPNGDFVFSTRFGGCRFWKSGFWTLVRLLFCLHKTTLQLELKELWTLNLVREFLVPVGRYNKVFEKIAHAQRVAAIEIFLVLKALLKNEKSYGLTNLVHKFLVSVGSHKNQYTKLLYKSLTEPNSSVSNIYYWVVVGSRVVFHTPSFH